MNTSKVITESLYVWPASVFVVLGGAWSYIVGELVSTRMPARAAHPPRARAHPPKSAAAAALRRAAAHVSGQSSSGVSPHTPASAPVAAAATSWHAPAAWRQQVLAPRPIALALFLPQTSEDDWRAPRARDSRQ